MRLRCVVGACVGVLLSTPAAYADLTLHVRTTYDVPYHGAVPAPGGPTKPHDDQTIYLSGRRIRVDDQNGPVIFDSASKQLTGLNRVRKTYSEMVLTSPQPTRAGVHPHVPGREFKVRVRDTGQTRTILGHACRGYVVTTALATSPSHPEVIQTIWAAKDIRIDPALLPPDGWMHVALVTNLAEVKGLPLEITSRQVSVGGLVPGMMTTTVTVVKIDNHPLSASMFRIPAGYQRQTGAVGYLGGPARGARRGTSSGAPVRRPR